MLYNPSTYFGKQCGPYIHPKYMHESTLEGVMHKGLQRKIHVFMSILQELIRQVIPSQKCQVNVSPILNSYRAMDI